MKISPGLRRNALRTRVVTTLAPIPPDEVQRIFPRVPENYFFFKTLDESGFDQFSFYYILAYERKQLVGVAPCFLVNYSLDTSISGPLRRITNSITKKFPRLFSLKALVVGIPMGQGQIGLAGDAPTVLKAIERRLESLARKMHAPMVAFKDFDGSYDGLFAPFLNKGFLKIDSEPMTRLKLEFSDFENYLKTLSGATRYDVRRKLKKAAAAGIESSCINILDDATLEEVYHLYLQAVKYHDMGFEILPKNFFRKIGENMPQKTKFFLWRIDGKLVAFVFCLVSGEVLLDYYLGLDYTLSHEYHLYFVKFKDVLNWCLQHGIKIYEMGQTGYEPKRRLGFEFVPVHLYVKARPRLLRPCIRILKSLLRFENFDPELRRWRKSPKSTKSP